MRSIKDVNPKNTQIYFEFVNQISEIHEKKNQKERSQYVEQKPLHSRWNKFYETPHMIRL